MFDGLPTGIPNTLGTPTAHPLPSREEATANGVAMLETLILAGNQPIPPHPKAVFEFGEIVIPLPIEILDAMKAAVGTCPHDYAVGALERFLADNCPDGVLTAEIADALPPDQRTRLATVATMGLLAGLPRWPEIPEGTPDEPPPGPSRH